jgi:DUF4097 and DUF4098 domain-containing protein YvlB
MKKVTVFNIIIVFLLVHSLNACTNFSNGILNDDLSLITEKTFQISPGNDLRIKVSGGDVIISPWDRSEVYIKVLGNDNAKEKLEFIFNNSDSYVELETEKKGSVFNWFSNISLKIEVKVPQRFNTNIHTSGGDIKLGGVDGSSEMHTSGGDIICRDFLGSLDVSTSGGDIRLRGGDTPIIAHTSGGDINLDYIGENKGIDLSTSGGDITINLPDDFNADMELSTSGGDVSCNITMNNASKLSEHKIIAELNEGGFDLAAHTSGGDIDVRKR